MKFLSFFNIYNDKDDQLDDVRQWYYGYRAGNEIHLYNPWSINSYLDERTLEAYWVDIGTATIKKLL
ncbi:unnamed protein product [Rhizophagus irregularis]|nr:unnamed protein product [Rhizophagus irregularis]CAB4411261.1 unnamed protein product [Rhizophagus irregularis]